MSTPSPRPFDILVLTAAPESPESESRGLHSYESHDHGGIRCDGVMGILSCCEELSEKHMSELLIEITR